MGRNSGEGGKSKCRDEVPTTAVESREAGGCEARVRRGTAGQGYRPAMAEKGVIKYVLLMQLLPSVNRVVLRLYTL